jgi:hypothetical protein
MRLMAAAAERKKAPRRLLGEKSEMPRDGVQA